MPLMERISLRGKLRRSIRRMRNKRHASSLDVVVEEFISHKNVQGEYFEGMSSTDFKNLMELYAHILDANRPKDFLNCVGALLNNYGEVCSRSIFAGKNRNYAHFHGVKVENPKRVYSDIYKFTMHTLFKPRKKESAEGRYAEIAKRLRGDKSFVRNWKRTIASSCDHAFMVQNIKSEGIDGKFNLWLLKFIDKLGIDTTYGDRISNIALSQYRDIFNSFNSARELTNRLACIIPDHHKADHKDIIRSFSGRLIGIHTDGFERLLGNVDFNDAKRLGFDYSLFTCTESPFVLHNLLYDFLNGTCILGPFGIHRKVSLLYELDPEIGVLRLMLKPGNLIDNNISNHNQAFGYAPIVRCEDSKGDLCWLVDSFDAGIPVECMDHTWMECFCQGIIDAATDPALEEKPSKLIINSHVRNRNNLLMLNYVKKVGEEKTQFLRKIGGTEYLRELGVKPAEHLLDAFRYSTKTVWTSDCCGDVKGYEINLSNRSAKQAYYRQPWSDFEYEPLFLPGREDKVRMVYFGQSPVHVHSSFLSEPVSAKVIDGDKVNPTTLTHGHYKPHPDKASIIVVDSTRRFHKP